MKRFKESGHVLILGIFMLMTMLAALGYVYEIGRLTYAKIQAQNATDAAALAADAELVNLRNIATTHYALADMWLNMARRAAFVEYVAYYIAMWGSYATDDLFPRGFLGDSKSEAYYRFGVSVPNAVYHALFHLQDGATTRFLATYEGKRHYSWWLRKDATNTFPWDEEVQMKLRFADRIQNAFSQLIGLYSGFSSFLPQDLTGDKYQWRKERMRQAALIATLYNLYDPYEGVLPAFEIQSNLLSTVRGFFDPSSGLNITEFIDKFDTLRTWIPQFLNALASLNPNDIISTLSGVGADPYSPLVGVVLPSFGPEGKENVPAKDFAYDLRNNALGGVYVKGIFLMPGRSIGRNLMFMFRPFTGPVPALPPLASAVLSKIQDVSSELPVPSTVLPPEVLSGMPYPILTRAAATPRYRRVPEARVMDVFQNVLEALFQNADSTRWSETFDQIQGWVDSIPGLGDMIDPVIFYEDEWYYPALAPAAGNIGTSSGVPAPYPDAYPYH